MLKKSIKNSAKILLKSFIFIILVSVLLFAGIIIDRKFFLGSGVLEQKIVREESVVIDVAEKTSNSVVTVSMTTPARNVIQFSPFGGISSTTEGGTPTDIGTGFIVSKDGLIITNKHVVSTANAKYKVITKDGKEYDALSISKDPSNDIAIIKIDANNLVPLELGDSSNLKVGQYVIAIGTALGEFRHTVTTGVVSGLGRGITAGNAYEGFVEKLDDVIQTDAAINPGNSGGPLLNSSGQVIGINVAVAQGAQNIGFAIPINTIKESLSQFNANGKFASKPYLGVRYQMVSLQTAVLNNIPQGAFVVEIVAGSPAEKSGVKVNDIITKIDGKELKEKDDLTSIISTKKTGDKIDLEIYRNKEIIKISTNLSEFSE
jgi:S1-C subfamily serine protease